MTQKYKVTGMSCAACSARVEKAVSSVSGVESCAVNLLTGDMSVSGTATKDEIIGAVTNAGYGVEIASTKKESSGEKAANSRSSLKLISSESVMPSHHLILCHPLLLPPSIFPSIRVFSNESVLWHQMAKVLEFQLQHQSFQCIFGTDFL